MTLRAYANVTDSSVPVNAKGNSMDGGTRANLNDEDPIVIAAVRSDRLLKVSDEPGDYQTFDYEPPKEDAVEEEGVDQVPGSEQEGNQTTGDTDTGTATDDGSQETIKTGTRGKSRTDKN